MKCLLALLTLCCSLAPLSANAATARRPIPDFTASETPKVFEVSKIDAIFAARGEKIVSLTFVKEFSPGGTRDATAIVPGQRKYYLGTSDLERFEKTRRKVSQLNNWSVGVARANWLWAENGYEGEVLPMTVMNHANRGVYVIVTEPTQVPSRMANRDTVVLQPCYIPAYNANESKFWFRPAVGAGLQSMEPLGFATPLISGSGGLRLGSTDVGIYAMEGQDFQPNLRGLCRYGVQFGDELGWALRIGYQSDWTEIRGDGHTDRRREGGEVGVAYGTPVFSISGYVNLGWYADRRNRDGQLEPGLGLALTLGPVYRSGN